MSHPDLKYLPDGRIICAICMEATAKEELKPVSDEPGKVWDVCKQCAALEGAFGVKY